MDRSSLLYTAVCDMKNHPEIDSWYSQVDQIKNVFKINMFICKPDKAGMIIHKIIRSEFDRFFKDKINQVKTGVDGLDHNKLRLYKTLKGYFRTEPYIE